jgi:hypothetical protein
MDLAVTHRTANESILERHLDDAFAALNAVSVRELEATAELLERRRDGLGKYASIFREVAWARQTGTEANLARFQLRQNVTSPREDVSGQIAAATAPFWAHVREALRARQELLASIDE